MLKSVSAMNFQVVARDGKVADNQQQDERSGQIINYTFKKLKAIFPAWRQAIENDSVESAIKAEWLAGLVENKINSKEQLERGFAKARLSDSPFFPSCGRFISWCKKPVKPACHQYFLPEPDTTLIKQASAGKMANLKASLKL